ncbi:MAG TPA: CSLREA domain-containing protein [Rubrobacter sp.]|nr:CSLREA domain-containing protein [Rubrobacter sp.]
MKTNVENPTGSTTIKTLVVGALILTMIVVSLMAPSQAHASAFPGANGKIVFSSSRSTGTGVDNPEHDSEIFTMNPDGTGLKQLTKNNLNDFAASYSADGKKIVFQSDRTGNFEVFVMNADGTAQTNLTKNPATDTRPSFSPEGKKILFDSARGSTPNNRDVFIMNSDGTGQKPLTTDPEEDSDATFSPSGDKIAFVSRRVDPQNNADGDIFTMNPDGTGQTRLTENAFEEGNPAFSPSGNEIAFATNRLGGGNPEDFDIFVMTSDGSTPTNFTGSAAKDTQPAFSPDGRKLLFVSTRDGGDEDVFVMDLPSGTNQTDITPNQNSDFAPDWQPVAKTFIVTSAADPGDGACDSNCTLREAINASNQTPGSLQNTIRFNIAGSGVQTITPTSNLPAITRPVLIDGYTQPGASPNTLATGGTNAALKVELNGINTSGSGSGLELQSSNNVIRGLVINRFSTGIGVFNFSGPQGTSGNRFEGNFIGTDPTGKLRRDNDIGVHIDGGSRNAVGGTTPAARNLISGNGEGIELSSGAQDNRLLGNLIGTTAGGAAPLGNDFWGVAMFNSSTSNNRIGDGTAVGSNIIAFNERDGIELDFPDSDTGNQISRNSIFSNGGLGIDLIGPTETDDTNISTPNDAGDADAGPNNLQNKPVLASAKNSSTKTTIIGKLDSTPGKTFKIEFYSNPSGNEGKKFIGQKSVTTGSNGNASFTFSPASKILTGQSVTATATDSSGNTSEFSAPRTVALSTGSDLTPQTIKLSGPSGVTSSPSAHFRFESPDPGVTFECSLDGGEYYECSSPENINRLSDGRHVFEVRAVDEEGNADPSPATWIWAVDRNG